jgi:hypothetical protein
LTCTACHSGPWPGNETILTKTSRAHKLGAPNVNKAPESLPHILSPVIARLQAIDTGSGTLNSNKIAPHKLLWPAFWGTMKDDVVQPIKISVVEEVIGNVFSDIELSFSGSWPQLSEEQITLAIKALNTAIGTDESVYICGGNLYSLDKTGALKVQENHPAARPYLWPIAHNVRPAAQSLGVRYCTDCHATDAPFFFGDITIDSPVVNEQGPAMNMIEFLDVRPFYTRAFAFSFVFRPWMKFICLGASAVLAMVLLLYALRALSCVAKALAGNDK